MMVRVSTPGLLAGFFVVAAMAPFSIPLPAQAQSEITVYAPFRGIATPIARAGSSVSVITREEIEQAGPTSVAEILRSVPGVSFNSSGGFGSSTNVRIRGAESQHTMVLIDGVPVSDPTDTRSSFDFRTLPTDLIERVEVLRGPQSALYGSDAMGGVINIITRQSGQGLSGSASVEGGSYGTHREQATVSYGGQGYSVLGAFSNTATEGFSRVQRDDEKDGTEQMAGLVRATVQISEQAQVEAQLQVTDTRSEYDATPTSTSTNHDRHFDLFAVQGHARARVETFDQRWIHTLTGFAGLNENRDDNGTRLRDYEGTRSGVDYTSEVRLGGFGTLLFGGSLERQTAQQGNLGAALQYDAAETYWSAFAMHQFSIGTDLHLSAAVRLDDFDDAGLFPTGRVTAVYDINASETRVHASLGTGAKAPTLYQRFGPAGPDPNLETEESFGADFGVTQVLFDGRATVDVTGFYNRFDNLIDFRGSFFTGGYVNVAEPETYGVEVTADVRVVPGMMDARAHYTYLVANDLETNLRLRRRPEHEAQATLIFTGIDRLQLSGTVNWVGGERYSGDGETLPLDPYVRVDANAAFQVHEHLEIYGRVENLFDADYEEIDGYNTPGLSGYVGVRTTF